MFTLLTALTLAAAAVAAGAADPRPAPAEHVLLLPGLARSGASMQRMSNALTQAGYVVAVVAYPSTEKTVAALAEEHLAPAVAACVSNGAARIHFVTHSLGGIVLRQYLSRHRLPVAGRAVMLGPPSQGSEVVDRLGSNVVFQAINGPAGNELGTDAASAPRRLPPPPLEFGVVAGTRSVNWILSTLIPGRDDGKVAIAKTKLPGMADFIELPVAHPFLMKDRAVIAHTLRFLRIGRFRDAPAATEGRPP